MMPYLLKGNKNLQARGKMLTCRSCKITRFVCRLTGEEGSAKKEKFAPQQYIQRTYVNFSKPHHPDGKVSDLLPAGFQASGS